MDNAKQQLWEQAHEYAVAHILKKYQSELAQVRREYWENKLGFSSIGIVSGIDTTQFLDDGFGNLFSKTCLQCGRQSMQVVRPGKVQCSYCG